MNRLLFLTLFLFSCCATLIAQPGQSYAPPVQGPEDTIHPKSSLIGEDEKYFESLSLDYNSTLLTVCDDDMSVAFSKWISMLQEMEAYADVIGYDLKGMKLWLNVFWEKNGKIKHIAFYPKPISRNTDMAELKAFFSSFVNHYSFPLTADDKYSHYGSATFPLHMPKEENKPIVGDGQ